MIRSKSFSSAQHLHWLWGPNSPCPVDIRGSFLMDKVTEHGGDTISLSTSAEAKNICSYTSNPSYIFMVWCLIKHGENFTFTFYSGHDQ
jgi:hypothetical protein